MEHIHNRINKKPTKCNLCGGDVIYTSNSIIYGKEYGNGCCYYCTNCGAFVGTHKNNPSVALGILANPEIRVLRKQCHLKFDSFWVDIEDKHERKRVRQECYWRLADEMDIYIDECHFGYFDAEELRRALRIISKWDPEEIGPIGPDTLLV